MKSSTHCSAATAAAVLLAMPFVSMLWQHPCMASVIDRVKSEPTDAVAVGMIVCAVFTAVPLLLGVEAPYGRYSSSSLGDKLGTRVPATLGWIIQESPCCVYVFWAFFFATDAARLQSSANVALLSMFALHYVNRTLIFPFRLRGGKSTPVGIVAAALFFCTINGYLQSKSLAVVVEYPDNWLQDPRFILGAAMFLAGFLINNHADHILINLRKPGETGYKVPRGGMFEYVSGANFFGEILEWTGYAVACWSLPAAAFAIYTASNIGPRAIQHHKWYLTKFEDYPAERRALIPFIL